MISKKILKKTTAVAVAAAMVVMSAVPAFADDINASQEATKGGLTYNAPTSAMTVDKNIVTATAHRAAAPILGMMGVNAVSGFGMINGGAPKDLADAKTRTALGIWGSSINSKADPYYWNYFYNFYAQANGLKLADDALVNDNVAASPVAADSTLKAEYGNVSVSLSKRPDVVVGCASSNGGTDTNGYDAQLATINGFAKDSQYYQEGDENYSPELVSYQTTTIKEMIQSVYALAEGIKNVEDKTGKTTRYGDVQTIASDYENYVYGMISYVREELAAKKISQKKIAVVTAINDDGTYDIADNYSQAATSLVRAYEYAMTVTTNLCDDYGTKVTKDQLLKADAILTFNNENIDQVTLRKSFGDSQYDGIILSNTPSAMYGVTMNSVENAMGYAYVLGALYSDVIDINPVDLCTYFYEHFCHVTDRSGLATVIQTNFAETILPKGLTGVLSNDYSSSAIESQLAKGKTYYNAHKSEFTDAECTKIGLSTWGHNYTKNTASAKFVIGAESYTKDGSSVAMDAAAYIDTNKRTMVPVRYIGNALGIADSAISYDNATRTATIGDAKITTGSKTITTSKGTTTMDTVAVNNNGRIYVPARFITEALGGSVEWDQATKTVTVTLAA